MANIEILHQIQSIVKKHNAAFVAVTKRRTIEEIEQIYKNGHKIFGENRVQELLDKYEKLPNDVEWHLIGHLQTNKVKYIVPFVSMIHSVDSEKLLIEINKRAEQYNRVIPCLLQFHIAEESTKFGLNLQEAATLLENLMKNPLPNIKICGVMGMATFTDDKAQVQREFKELNSIFKELKAQFFSKNDDFKEISMGMSSDYELALSEGSTMVRVGSLLFN